MTASKKMTAKQIVAAAYEMAGDPEIMKDAAEHVVKYPLLSHAVDPANYLAKASRSVVLKSLEYQQSTIRGFAKMVAAHRIATA